MDDQIDLTIPRGGKGLIQRVVSEASMPVLKHFEGICHLYVDATAEREIFAEVPWIPGEMKEVVGLVMGC